MNIFGKSLRLSSALCTIMALFLTSPIYSQQRIDLNLDKAVEIMMNNSYTIKRLEMSIQQSRFSLKAERAALKSKVYMNVISPDLNKAADYKWNSTLQRDEVVRQNSDRWQSQLSIKQPIIIFGYPTNGNISLNFQLYQYNQNKNNKLYTTFYNRTYLSFEQPLFQPNDLKNSIEEAELDLEEEELNYITDQVEIIKDISEEYYDLFELVYKSKTLNNYLNNLKEINTIVVDLAQRDTTKLFEKKQVELVTANAQDALMANQSEIRTDKARMIQRLRLSESDIIDVNTDIHIIPITVNQEQAIEYAFSLRPSMRFLEIDNRKTVIDFQNIKANDALKIDLEMTYGLEKSNDKFNTIWDKYDNSNSITLNTYIPIWDWGRRKARIEAGKISLNKMSLSIEERRTGIKTEVTNSILNLNENQARVLKMQESVNVANEITLNSINQYKNNEISLQDLLQIISRQKETEDNFLDSYLEYRYSVLNLMINTYYNYEKKSSLIDELKSKIGNKNN